MVIFEGTISRKVFKSQLSFEDHVSHNNIVFGLARIAASTMFVYLFLKLLVLVHDRNWQLLATPMGHWYLLEVLGFVLLPCMGFLYGLKLRSLAVIRTAAVFTLIGILLNRLNVSIIAFKWYAPVRYVPTWMEIEVTLSVVVAEIMVFRWIVNRMPVLQEIPQWAIDKVRRERTEKSARKQRPGVVTGAGVD